jgi:hypothetical protein
MRSILCCLLAGCSLASGCASIVNGTTQLVTVETHRDQTPVEGASCELVNSKGTYHVKTPGTIPIGRAYGDLSVRCEKSGMDVGMTSTASSTKAMVFGNILLGGAIGAALDTSSGAAYEYPELIRVEMGFNVASDGTSTPTSARMADKPGPIALARTDATATPAATTNNATPAAAPTAGPVAMDDLRHLLAPR